MTDEPPPSLAERMARIETSVEHMREDMAESSRRSDARTAQLTQIAADVAALTRSIQHLEAQGREAHDTTRLVDRRAAADEARETGADNRRSLLALVISGVVAVWTIAERLTGGGPNP